MTEFTAAEKAAFRDFEHAGWENAADAYTDFERVTDQTIAPLLDAAGVGKDTALLDIATGQGGVAAAAAKRGAKATGLDFSPNQLAAARARHPDITFVEGDAADMPFDDSSFDAVVCNYGVLHFPDTPRAVADAFRVLNPGGRYAYSAWALGERGLALMFAFASIKACGNLDAGLPPGPAFDLYARPDVARDMVESAGFVDVEIASLDQIWPMDDPDRLFEVSMRSMVRSTVLLQKQTPEALEGIRDHLRGQVEKFAANGRYELPMPAALVSGRKP